MIANKKILSLLIIFSSIGSLLAQVPTADFSFNGIYSSTGINVTVAGGIPFAPDRCGNSSSTISISGLSQFISVENGAAINPTNQFTIMAWIYNLSNTGGAFDQKVFSKEGAGRGYSFGIKNTRLSLTILDNSGLFIQTPTTIIGLEIPLGSWTHIAASYRFTGTHTVINHYVNGQMMYALTTTSTILGTTTNNATIGQYNTFTQYPLIGNIDDLKLFQTFLTDSQIANLYSTSTITSGIAALCPGAGQVLSADIIPSISGITYQWYKGTITAVGTLLNAVSDGGIYGTSATTQDLTITNIPQSLTGSYFRNVITGVCDGGTPTNFGNAITTLGVMLTVNHATSISGISLSNATKCEFSNQTVSISTISGTNLSYQWTRNGVNITMAESARFGGSFTTTSLNISSIPLSFSGSVFECIVTGDCGVVTSSGFTLSVLGTNTLACPTGWWKFDGNFNDADNKYTTSVLGSPILSNDKCSNASSSMGVFGNPSNYLLVTNNAALNPTTEITISAWIYSFDATNDSKVVSKWNGASGGYILGLQNNSVYLEIFDTNGDRNYFNTGATTVSSSRWHHIAASWKTNGIMKAYIDGKLVYTQTGSAFNVAPSTTNLYIGRSTFAGNDWNGYIDDLKIFTKELALSDIRSEYAISTSNYSYTTACSFGNQQITLSPTTTGLTYRWAKSGALLNGSSDGGIYGNTFSTAGLNISAPPASLSGLVFDCVIGSVCGGNLPSIGFSGNYTVSGATLTVIPNTSILSPSSTNYCIGGTTILGVTTLSGSGLTFNWGEDNGMGFEPYVSNSSSILGFNNRVLTITGIPAGVSSIYICSVTGVCGNVSTTGATITNLANTSVSGITASTNPTCTNSLSILSTTAIGSGLTYRWLRNSSLATANPAGNTLLGINTPILSIYTDNQANDLNGDIFVLSVTGTCGVVTTTGLTLTVNGTSTISTQPTSVTVCGDAINVPFNVVGSGGAPFTYAWYRGTSTATGIPINASTDGGIYGNTFSTSGLNLSSVTPALSSFVYYCKFGSSCGFATTTGASLTFNSLTGISVNPPSLFSTCVGQNLASSMAATGSGLNFYWQIFSAGTWTNLSNGGIYSGVNSNTLSISGLPVSVSGTNYRCSVVGICGNTVSSVSTVQTNLGPLVNFFGLDAQYCSTDPADELTGFTNLIYPYNTASGVFALESGPYNPIVPSGFNTANFTSSLVGSSTGISIRFTSAPDQFGCTNYIVKSTNVSNLSSINVSFGGLGSTTFLNTGSPVTLTGIPSSGGSGVFSSTEPVMVGNVFYPSFVTNIPTGGSRLLNITYTFTQSVSGCSKSFTRNSIQVFDDVNIFTFTGGGGIFYSANGTPSFCMVDDISTYNLSFIGISTPEIDFGTTNTGICATSQAYTISGYNAVTGTLGSMSGFTFTPSLLPITGSPISYQILYLYDELLTPSTVTCGGPRTGLKQYSTPQRIIMNPKPPIPSLPLSSNARYCQGSVPNSTVFASGTALEWFTVTSSSPIVTAKSATLSQLGIDNNALPGNYTRYVRQRLNGCYSNFASFTVTITAIPASPVITSTLTGNAVCTYYYDGTFLNAVSSTTGSVYNWFDVNNFQLASNLASNRFQVFPYESVEGTLPYFASATKDGCTSPRTRFDVRINPRPDFATFNGYNFACINHVTPFDTLGQVSVAYESNSLIGFNWKLNYYYDGATSSYVFSWPVNSFIGSNVTSQSGSVFTGKFSPGITADNSELKRIYYYYVTPFYQTTGCESFYYNYFEIGFRPQPAPISVTQPDIFCNSPNFHNLSVTSASILGDYANWYGSQNRTNQLFSVSGNALSVKNYLPTNSYLNYIDTTFYITQVQNGCESTTSGVKFRMYPPFKKLTINNLSSLPGILLPNLTTVGCSGRTLGLASIAGSFLPSSISGIWRSEWLDSFYSSTTTGFTYNLKGYNANSVLGINVRQSIIVNSLGGVCYSDGTTSGFTLNIKQTPSQPIYSDTSFCMPNPVGTITGKAMAPVGSGISQRFNWYYNRVYDNVDFIYLGQGTPYFGTDIPNTVSGLYTSKFVSTLTGTSPTVSGTFFRYFQYLSQTVNGCESPAIDIFLDLYNSPAAPVVSNSVSICSGEPLNTLTGQGVLVKWYEPSTVASGFSQIGSGTFYYPAISNTLAWTDSSNAQSSVAFYATQTLAIANNIYGCESEKSVVTVTVKAVPPKPTVNNLVSYCLQVPIMPLTALGLNDLQSDFRWYSTASDTLLRTNSTKSFTYISGVSNAIPDSYEFFVSQVFNNCESKISSIELNVNSLPSVNFSGLGSIYCQYDNPVLLTGTPTPTPSLTFGTFTGKYFNGTVVGNNIGVLTNTLSGKALFNPQFSSSRNEITYIFTDANGCTDSTTQIANSYPRPISTFSISPPLSADICDYRDDKYTLKGLGTFTGKGVVNVGGANSGEYSFEPSNANVIGRDTITYSFVDIYGCQSDSLTIFNINPTPTVRFSQNNNCATDSVRFVDLSSFNTTVPAAISRRIWRIEADTAITPTYHYIFSSPETYEVRLEVESDKGCVSDTLANIVIGAYPNVDFIWNNICNGDTTRFINQTTIQAGGGNITGFNWDFGVSGGVSSLTSPGYYYQVVGSYSVTLSATTDQNCLVQKQKIINTLPTVKNFPYTQNFDSDNGQWFADGLKPSWVWTLDNQNWTTTANNGHYNGLEKSALNGPCFDLSLLQKPMFKSNLAYKTGNGDGAVIQFSTDGITWYPLGTNGTGQNWYNKQSIISDPGDQQNFYSAATTALNQPRLPKQMGWTGTSPLENSVSVRNILDPAKKIAALSGAKSVRLRLAFASIQENTLSGIKLDDVWVGERSRVSLVENFANANSAASNSAQSSSLDLLVDNLKNDAVTINYHTSFPVSDEFNKANPSDPGARVLYYGLENIPRVALDGQMVSGLSTNLGENLIFVNALSDPRFHINLAMTNTNNTIKVDADFIALDTITGEQRELIAYIAIVENTVEKTINGKTIFRNVLKRTLPSAAGNSFFGNWTVGSGRSISENLTYVSSDFYDVSQIGVAAFIQDKKDNQVLQAVYLGKNASVVPISNLTFTGVTADNLITQDIILAPNPANNVVNIILKQSANDELPWVMFNTVGVSVINGKISKGENEATISTDELTPGMYIIQIGSVSKKLVISR
jgi:hypothetical protein